MKKLFENKGKEWVVYSYWGFLALRLYAHPFRSLRPTLWAIIPWAMVALITGRSLHFNATWWWIEGGVMLYLIVIAFLIAAIDAWRVWTLLYHSGRARPVTKEMLWP